MMQRICVFCGSSPGGRPEYGEAARQLGEALAERHLGLVYGGASVGIMGQLARTVIDAGGEVIGVIPEALATREIALTALPDLRIVGSMHERKALMVELADGFIALPGGLGTLDELFAVLTWAQLGLHHKPCGLLNVCAYYDELIRFLDHGVEQSFVHECYRSVLRVDSSPEGLLDQFADYRVPEVDKATWVQRMNGAR
jgi:uncharacterized protein (TIGR00730 family)